MTIKLLRTEDSIKSQGLIGLERTRIEKIHYGTVYVGYNRFYVIPIM